MQITFDPTNPDELTAVSDLIEHMSDSAPAAKSTPPAKKASTPRKRAAAKPDPEPESDEDEGDDLLGTDGPTKKDAVKKATEMVEAGETATVRAALKKLGAKRVTDLEDDQVEEFLEALSA